MTALEILKEQLDYFIGHQDELVQKHRGKVLVIKDKAVVGVYGSEWDAYAEATKAFEPGTFLIQKCLAGQNAYTQQFVSSHVSFI